MAVPIIAIAIRRRMKREGLGMKLLKLRVDERKKYRAEYKLSAPEMMGEEISYLSDLLELAQTMGIELSPEEYRSGVKQRMAAKSRAK